MSAADLLAAHGLTAEQFSLATLNLSIAAASVWACFCRLNAGSKRTMRWEVRLKYVALLSASGASGLSFLVGEWPGFVTCSLNAVVFLGLAVEMHRWKDGIPDDVKTQPALLGEPELNSVPGGAKHEP